MSFSVNLGLLAVLKVKLCHKITFTRFNQKEVRSKLENIFWHRSVPIIIAVQKCFISLHFNSKITNVILAKNVSTCQSWNKIYKCNPRWSCILPSTSLTTRDSSFCNTAWDSLWLYTYWADLEIYIPAPGCVKYNSRWTARYSLENAQIPRAMQTMCRPLKHCPDVKLNQAVFGNNTSTVNV